VLPEARAWKHFHSGGRARSSTQRRTRRRGRHEAEGRDEAALVPRKKRKRPAAEEVKGPLVPRKMRKRPAGEEVKGPLVARKKRKGPAARKKSRGRRCRGRRGRGRQRGRSEGAAGAEEDE